MSYAAPTTSYAQPMMAAPMQTMAAPVQTAADPFNSHGDSDAGSAKDNYGTTDTDDHGTANGNADYNAASHNHDHTGTNCHEANVRDHRTASAQANHEGAKDAGSKASSTDCVRYRLRGAENNGTRNLYGDSAAAGAADGS